MTQWRYINLVDQDEFVNFYEEADDFFMKKPLQFSNGDLIWPFIRCKILFAFLSFRYDLEPPHARRGDEKFSVLSYISDMFKLRHSKRLHETFPIVFFTTAASRDFVKDGKYFNRLHDYFAFLRREETLEVEQSFRMKYRLPAYFENIISFDKLLIEVVLRGGFSIRFPQKSKLKQHSETIFDFLKAKKLDFDVCEIYRLLSKFERRILVAEKIFEKFLRKFRPKVIFVHCASYGGLINSVLVRVAKKLGIVVCEFQHGVITKAHPAYNYGETVCRSAEYIKYLPDYLLTYGDFWNGNMVFPNKCVTIGNPGFWEHYNGKKFYKEKRVLIVSQGSLTKEYVGLAKALSRMLPSDYEILFKLHPGEVPFEERYRELYELKNVIVVKTGNIYNYLRETKYVISICSTTIFEAFALGNVVFVYSHPLARLHIPPDIGFWVDGPEEIAKKILKGVEPTQRHKIDYFFERDWADNYVNFLKNI
ncbi:MAG: hypothetical protein PWP31_1906 [Clostridia bacterium]|nr:hypothetical protein [Clostridia bacterium]